MKFKELKKLLSCIDTYEIWVRDNGVLKTFDCNYDNIDETADLYNLNNAIVILIKATDEDRIYISLKITNTLDKRK